MITDKDHVYKITIAECCTILKKVTSVQELENLRMLDLFRQKKKKNLEKSVIKSSTARKSIIQVMKNVCSRKTELCQIIWKHAPTILTPSTSVSKRFMTQW